MAWDLTIAGVSQKAKILVTGGLSIRLESSERATLRCTLQRVGGYMPARFDPVLVYDKSGALMYGGIILSREADAEVPALETVTISCVDWWVYLDWALVTLNYTAPVTTKTILTALVAALPAGYGFTVSATQANGLTYESYSSGVDAKASGVLRGLARDLGYRPDVSPAKVLAVVAPGTTAAPHSITTAAPHCQAARWADPTGTPANRIVLRCGPAGVGEFIAYNWVGDGSTRVFKLAGVAVPSSSVWPGVCFVGGVQFPIWLPGEGPPDHIEWDYALDDGTLTFVGSLTVTPGVGEDVELRYAPQYPFTVIASAGLTPEISEPFTDETIIVYEQGKTRAAALLAERNQPAARELAISSQADGWRPDQVVAVNLTQLAFAGNCTIGAVDIRLQLDDLWLYQFTAAETTIVPGSALDIWRKLIGGSSGTGAASTAIGGAGGGGGGELPAIGPAQIYVGSAASVATAVAMTGDIGIDAGGVTAIAAGVIVNADVAPAAGIVDSKLATLTTPGKVANSATTAATGATPDTIALRTNVGDLFARGVGADFVSTPLVSSAAALALTSGGVGDITFTPGGLVTVPAGKRLQTAYTAGFTGSGYSLSHNSARAGQSYLEVDGLTVRGTMNVYELIAHQIRATNGSVFVANTGRVKTVTPGGGIVYTIETEGDHGFAVNDILRAQRFVAAGGRADVFVCDFFVTGVASSTVFTGNLQLSATVGPVPGMDFVRLGNTTDTNRQGSIYLTADDLNAPYIQILDGVNTYAAWGSAAKTKGRIGQLQGSYDYTASIYGAAFGDQAGAHLSIDPFYGVRIGYGATTKVQIDLAGNATFAGTVTATAGAIGGFLIGPTLIRDVADSMGLESTESAGDDIRFWAGTTWASRAAAPFTVTKSGALTARRGTVGGWTLLPNYLYAEQEGNPLALNSSLPSIEMGNPRPTSYGAVAGLWMGKDAGVFKFRVGNPGGAGFYWDGSTATFVGAGGGITSINGANIQTGTITATQIATDAITAIKIAAGAVTAGKIGADAVTAGKIAADAVTTRELDVDTLSAITGNMGTLTAGSITGGSITGVTISGVTISGSTITAGSTTIDSSGITVAAGGFSGSRIKWTDGSDIGSGGNTFRVHTNDGCYFDVPNYVAINYLSGSGNRNVYADASGSLRSGAPVTAFEDEVAASPRIADLERRLAALEAGGAT